MHRESTTQSLKKLLLPLYHAQVGLKKTFGFVETEAVHKVLVVQGVSTPYISVRVLYCGFATKIVLFYILRRRRSTSSMGGYHIFEALQRHPRKPHVRAGIRGRRTEIDGRQLHNHHRFADDIVLITPSICKVERTGRLR